MYKVDLNAKRLVALTPTTLSSCNVMERFDLQEWIESTPEILGEKLLILAKELPLSSGTRLDLLAIDKSGALVVVELKRDDSGNNVDWQAVRYASYCSGLLKEDIIQTHAAYLGIQESEAEERIAEFIDEDMSVLNARQRIILCARQFHSDVVSSVLWLRDYEVDVSCLRIEPYIDTNGQLFLNADIIIPLPEAKDYVERRERRERDKKQRDSWTGFWFVNVGDGVHRNWDDNVKYGYIGAGQGRWASSGLDRLNIGDRIFAYIRGLGYVGYGIVTRRSTPITEFVVESHDKLLLELPLDADRPHENKDDPELREYCVGVAWRKAFPRNDAKTFKGVFANQNIACKLRHRSTFEFLRQHFEVEPAADSD